MDIKVGSVAPVGTATDRSREQPGTVEAKLLAIRDPRRRSRRGHPTREPDPVNARVLVLMVPDGTRIPESLQDGSWRVFLRFARR